MATKPPSNRGGGAGPSFDPAVFRGQIAEGRKALREMFILPAQREATLTRQRLRRWILTTPFSAAAGLLLTNPWDVAHVAALILLAPAAVWAVEATWRLALSLLFSNRILGEFEQGREAAYAVLLPKDVDAAKSKMASRDRRAVRRGVRLLVKTHRVRTLIQRDLMVGQVVIRRRWGWTLAYCVPAGLGASAGLVLTLVALGRQPALTPVEGFAAVLSLLIWVCGLACLLAARSFMARIGRTLEPEGDDAIDADDPVGEIEVVLDALLKELLEHQAFTRRAPPPEEPDEEEDDLDEAG